MKKDAEKRALAAGLKRYPVDIIGHRKTMFSEQDPIDGNLGKRIFFMEGHMESSKDYEMLPKINGWLARDKDGNLSIFENTPIRGTTNFAAMMGGYRKIQKDLFPEVTWQSSPVKVELLIRKV